MYKVFFKRFFDILLSAAALLALWWLMAIVAVLIRLESRGPAIFRQQRLGRGGREFTFYKFRSMSVGAERTGSGVYSGKNDSRVTRIGKILRATSIDELPQLWNILKGDMSLIGPRPPLTYHPWPIDQYTEFQRRMFEVRLKTPLPGSNIVLMTAKTAPQDSAQEAFIRQLRRYIRLKIHAANEPD